MFRRVMAATGLGRLRASRAAAGSRPPAPILFGGQYDEVVSLGRGCQPAHQIRARLGITSAHIFDWVITTDAGLAALVASDLDGFFAPGRLGPGPSGVIVDLPTDTRFVHEFPKGADLGARHAQNAGRMAMLAARWRGLLASDRRVLFVRMHMDDADPRASAVRLCDAIRQRAPSLRFTILYLTGDPADEVPWGVDRVINRQLSQPEPYDWRGDDAAWARLLREALAGATPWTTAAG